MQTRATRISSKKLSRRKGIFIRPNGRVPCGGWGLGAGGWGLGCRGQEGGAGAGAGGRGRGLGRGLGGKNFSAARHIRVYTKHVHVLQLLHELFHLLLAVRAEAACVAEADPATRCHRCCQLGKPK